MTKARSVHAGALLFGLLVAGCGEGLERQATKSAPAPGLDTQLVELREIELSYSAEAVVEAVRQSTVAAQIAGRVVDIRFDAGDFVKKGEVIVRIDERAATQAVAASEAQVREAQAALAKRARTTSAPGSCWRRSSSARQRSIAPSRSTGAAQAHVAALLAGAGQAETARSFTTIVAPYSGVVSARHVELGEMAVPGKPLMTGFDPSTLRVVALVPQTQVSAVQALAKARIELPSLASGSSQAGHHRALGRSAHTHHARAARAPGRRARRLSRGLRARALRDRQGDPAARAARAVVRRAELTAVYVVVGSDGRGCARCGWARPATTSKCSPACRPASASRSSRKAAASATAGHCDGRIPGHLRPHRALLPGRRRSRRCWHWSALLLGALRRRWSRRARRSRRSTSRWPTCWSRSPVRRCRTSSRWSPRLPSRCSRRSPASSTSCRCRSPGLAVITVQFKVGVPRTEALVRLYDTVHTRTPTGCPRAWASGADHQAEGHRRRAHRHADAVQRATRHSGPFDLERVAHSVEAELKRVPGTREVATIGGPGRAVLVEIDRRAWPAPASRCPTCAQALQSANLGLPVGELLAATAPWRSRPAPFLRDAREVGGAGGRHARGPAGVPAGRRQRARRRPAGRSATSGTAAGQRRDRQAGGEFPAVTIAGDQEAGRERDRRGRRGDAARRSAARHPDPARRAASPRRATTAPPPTTRRAS